MPYEVEGKLGNRCEPLLRLSSEGSLDVYDMNIPGMGYDASSLLVKSGRCGRVDGIDT